MLDRFKPEKAKDLLTITLHIIFSNSKVTRDDLAEICDKSIPSIDRYLSDLRSVGIQIHSEARSGVELISEIDENLYKCICNEFIIAKFSSVLYLDDSFDFSDLNEILGDKLVMKFIHGLANKLFINVSVKNTNGDVRFISCVPLHIFKLDEINIVFQKDETIHFFNTKELSNIQLLNDLHNLSVNRNEIEDKVKRYISQNTVYLRQGPALVRDDNDDDLLHEEKSLNQAYYNISLKVREIDDSISLKEKNRQNAINMFKKLHR